MKTSRQLKRQGGFTLIEVLVAMAITLFVSVIAYISLTAAINGADRSQQTADELAGLQAGLSLIERDIRHMVNRTIIDEYGDPQAALSGGTTEDIPLQFSRNGWENPLGDRRSELQRVAYWVDGDELKRDSWTVMDRLDREESFYEDRVFGGVVNLEVRFLEKTRAVAQSGLGGDWVDLWVSKGDELPLAVELTIEFEDWGEITRVIQVVPRDV